MNDPESLRLMADIGVGLSAMLAMAYVWCVGYLVGRPSKLERQIIVRALAVAPASQDPIIASRTKKLMNRLALHPSEDA